MGVPHGPKRAPHVRLDGRGRPEARLSVLIQPHPRNRPNYHGFRVTAEPHR